MAESTHVLQLIDLARDLLARLERGWGEFLAQCGSFEVDASPEKMRELAAMPRTRQQHKVRMLFPAQCSPLDRAVHQCDTQVAHAVDRSARCAAAAGLEQRESRT